MSVNRFLVRFGIIVCSALVPVAGAFAQCVPVNLVTQTGFPITTYQTFPQNNTICQFGGYNVITQERGLISCLSASVAINSANQNAFQSILAKATLMQAMSSADISRITNEVDYAVISRESPTTPSVFDFALMNKTSMLQWVVGYPSYASNLNIVRFSSVSGNRRTSFTPRNRSVPGTSDVTMNVDRSNDFIGIAGYDKFNAASRFMIYRIESHAPGHEFDPFQVCTGPQATLFTDVFHRYGVSAGGMTTPANQRFIPFN